MVRPPSVGAGIAARDVLQKLIDRLQELNRESEIPSPQAWKKAKEQIEGGSQTYESEKS